MKRNLLILFSICFLSQIAVAQTPKWFKKAKGALFSVVTYDKNDNILATGNGFYISEDGVGVSDYTLFKNAAKAVAIDTEGQKFEITALLGANEMYDLIKFQVNNEDAHALEIAPSPLKVGEKAYLLPYATQQVAKLNEGVVEAVTTISQKYAYYTLKMSVNDKSVSCPLVNDDGEVVGLMQKSTAGDADKSYAIDVNYAAELSINALSLGDASLTSIAIKKGLPESEKDALIYLFMASNQLDSLEYSTLLDDFIDKYPKSSEGYLRRANNKLTAFASSRDQLLIEQANADLDEALHLEKKKDQVYFSIAKLLYSYNLLLTSEDVPYEDWDLEHARKAIEKAYEINPLPIYKLIEGNILFAQKEYKAAYDSYDVVNKSELASPQSYFSAAKSRQMAGDSLTVVKALLDSCINLTPQPVASKDAAYLLERAQINSALNQWYDALEDYNGYFKAVNGQVNDVFYDYRHQAAVKAHRYQQALDDIAKAIEMVPDKMMYRSEEVALYLKIGQFEKAIEKINAALEVDANYAELYRLLGVAQLQLKKKSDACRSFQKAKELGDPIVDQLIKKYCD